MSFQRAMSRSGGLAKDGRAGDGWYAHLSETIQSADSDQAISVAALNGGLYVRTGATANRSDTLPTAAAIIAANPDMDIGDSFVVLVSMTVAFTLTILTNTGITLSGIVVAPASGRLWLVVTRTGTATVGVRGI